MPFRIRPIHHRRVVIALHDSIMLCVAWTLAYLVRFEFELTVGARAFLLHTLPVVLVAQSLVLWWTGLYRGLWRFSSIPDLWNILRAALLGAVSISLLLFLINRLEGVPRSTLMLYPVFLVALLSGPRLTYRVWHDRKLGFPEVAGTPRVLILGAGRAGEMLARDMLHERQLKVIGFLDDDRVLRGTRVRGVPVYGTIEDAASVVREHGIDLLVIAMPSATAAQMQRAVEIAKRTGAQVRTLPKLQDLVPGQPGVGEMREVQIEDLLWRDPVHLDWEAIQGNISGRTVMVTGGGGSIGSELCRQIARLGPASLVIYEANEYNLYRIDQELRRGFPGLALHTVLGNVCDGDALDRLMLQHKPELVFHAAAYKHVPMLETHAREAFHNNVIGTRTVAEAADRHGVSTFVLISTDKAVRPANVMGSTKRLAELYCQSFSTRSRTAFITVRFGNVLDSSGSVIPLFRQQIAAGGPVTVTHPEITRFFMTIQEACQLILQGAAIGKGGEVFVLEMGEPVRLSYLAEQMILLSGHTPGEDIQISYIGLRPGEKLHEELFYEDENMVPTQQQKIRQALHQPVERKRLNEHIGALEQLYETGDNESIRARLGEALADLQRPATGPADNVIQLH